MESKLKLRIAVPEDADGILRVYAPYIENTTVTFEYEVPTVEEFRARIAKVLECYPYIVCEDDGVIAGYAYASAMGTREAWMWSAESSIYVDAATRGRGIGTILYSALEELLTAMGIAGVYARISLPDLGSVSFHEARGYVSCGVMERCGYKLGRWLDLVTMKKELAAAGETPAAPIWFSELDRTDIETILERMKNNG